MIFCRSRKLREKTMNSYEQALRLFEKWCKESLEIETVDKITENVIRRYINEPRSAKSTRFSPMTVQGARTFLSAEGTIDSL